METHWDITSILNRFFPSDYVQFSTIHPPIFNDHVIIPINLPQHST